jgi:hypothetical protein
VKVCEVFAKAGFASVNSISHGGRRSVTGHGECEVIAWSVVERATFIYANRGRIYAYQSSDEPLKRYGRKVLYEVDIIAAMARIKSFVSRGAEGECDEQKVCAAIAETQGECVAKVCVWSSEKVGFLLSPSYYDVYYVRKKGSGYRLFVKRWCRDEAFGREIAADIGVFLRQYDSSMRLAKEEITDEVIKKYGKARYGSIELTLRDVDVPEEAIAFLRKKALLKEV